MLALARQLAPYDVPLIGINQGRLGFLTDIPLSQMTETLAAMLDGRYVEQRRTLLSMVVERKDGGREEALALNDVVVNRGSLGAMIDCAVPSTTASPTRCAPTASSSQRPPARPRTRCPRAGPILAPAARLPRARAGRAARADASADRDLGRLRIAITVMQRRDAGVHCDGQGHFSLAEAIACGSRAPAFRRASCIPRLRLFQDAAREAALERRRPSASPAPEPGSH